MKILVRRTIYFADQFSGDRFITLIYDVGVQSRREEVKYGSQIALLEYGGPQK